MMQAVELQRQIRRNEERINRINRVRRRLNQQRFRVGNLKPTNLVDRVQPAWRGSRFNQYTRQVERLESVKRSSLRNIDRAMEDCQSQINRLRARNAQLQNQLRVLNTLT